MKTPLSAVLLAAVLFTASCGEKNRPPVKSHPPVIRTGPFQFSYADKRQPENVRSGGEVPQIAFNFVYGYEEIQGENLKLHWQGKIKLSQEEAVIIQTAAPVRLKIDDTEFDFRKNLAHNPQHTLSKGEHSVSVDYEPSWHAGSVVVNFLPASEKARAPEALAADIKAKSRDIVRFATVYHTVASDERGVPIDSNLEYDAVLPVPTDSKEQIIVLNSYDLVNVVMQPEKGARIKAIVATPTIGTISGSDAPVYRLDTAPPDTNYFTAGCHCIGGIHLSCNTKTPSYEPIQNLSQTLFGKPVDYFYHSRYFKQEWFANERMQAIKQRTDNEHQKALAQCGGSEAVTFDRNALSTPQGSLKTDDKPSWFSRMNDTVPAQGFKAYYFTQDSIGKPVASETVPHIAINYPYETFHNINAEKFAALWVGNITVPTDTLMDMQYDLSQADLRIRVDGKIVHERTVKDGQNDHNPADRFDLLLSKGKHQIEVEYINHWHTVGFALHPQPKQLAAPDSEAQALVNNPNYAVIRAEVYESSKLDSSLKTALPSSDKPVVLLLKSHDSVFWQIEQGDTDIKAVIIEDGKGIVQGSRAPVLRVNRLPNAARTDREFYQYSRAVIDAGDWKTGKSDGKQQGEITPTN